jgi:hypothetical protein
MRRADSRRFWGWSTVQVLHCSLGQIRLKVSCRGCYTQQRICKLSDICLQLCDPLDVILNIASTWIEPVSDLTSKVHRETELDHFLLRSFGADYCQSFRLFLRFTPSRVDVQPLVVVSVAPRILCSCCERNLTRTPTRLQCFTGGTKRAWRIRDFD